MNAMKQTETPFSKALSIKDIELQAKEFTLSFNWLVFCEDDGVTPEITEVTSQGIFAKVLGYTNWEQLSCEGTDKEFAAKVFQEENQEKDLALISKELNVSTEIAEIVVESLYSEHTTSLEGDSKETEVLAVDEIVGNPESLETTLLELFDNWYEEDAAEEEWLSLTRSEACIYQYTQWLIETKAPEQADSLEAQFEKHFNVIFNKMKSMAIEGKLLCAKGSLFQDPCDYYGSIKGREKFLKWEKSMEHESE